jgi:hypothetical protein
MICPSSSLSKVGTVVQGKVNRVFDKDVTNRQ